MNIPLARLDITEAEIEGVVKILRRPYLALGPKVNELEKAVADYAGIHHAVAVNSGTSALHLIVRPMEIGEADEVITASFCCLLLSCIIICIIK